MMRARLIAPRLWPTSRAIGQSNTARGAAQLRAIESSRHGVPQSAPLLPQMGFNSPRHFTTSIPLQYAGASKKRTPSELEELRALVKELSGINQPTKKTAIVANASPAVRELLIFMYDPDVRFNMSSKGFTKYVSSGKHLKAQKSEAASAFPETATLQDVLRELQSGSVSGNAALDLVATYAHRNGIFEEDPEGDLSLLTILNRVLDRNLRAGFSASTVRAAYFGEAAGSDQNTRNGAFMNKTFSVPLGHEVKPEEMPALFAMKPETDAPWMVSRKLDGIRCLMDMTLSQNDAGEVVVTNVQTVSRNGKPFETLGILKDDLVQCLPSSKSLRDFLVNQDGSGKEHHIFLDGEICVLKPARDGDGGNKFVEDFRGVAGQLQRKSTMLPRPAFFPFDIVTADVFYGWRESAKSNSPFAERIKLVENIVKDCIQSGSKCLRVLEQSPVYSEEDVGRWTDIAVKSDWEGLILRDGQSLYEGKRTKAIRKVKQMIDAEYTVEGIETAEMRLAIDGKYAQRNALASIIIRHKGTAVNVGSGFTAEQRVRFATNPDLIVGRQVTVCYFEESFANSRADGGASLRFPVVKSVWEGGERDM